MDGAITTGLATAFDLAALGARMVEARYRREHPDATDDEVAARVRAWWLDRPDAPHGVGNVRSSPAASREV